MATTNANNSEDHGSLALTTSTLMLFFGCIFFLTFAILSHQAMFQVTSFRLFDLSWWQWASLDPLNVASIKSILTFLVHWSVLGLVLVYVYLCENHFPHTSKPYWDPDQVASWMALIISVAVWYGDPENQLSSTNRSLNNNKRGSSLFQEERILHECKGWTFLIFVLYRCYQHEKPSSLAMDLFIGSHVWWNSFHHALYFYATSDFSISRILQSVWRPGSLLVLFQMISVAKGRRVIYFLCGMELLSFAVTYLVFSIGCSSRLNDSKWGIRIKLAVTSILFYFIWDVQNPRLFLWLFGIFFSEESNISVGMDTVDDKGALWEWYMISTQYHWCILFGIVAAINIPTAIVWRDKLEKQAEFASSFTGSKRTNMLALAARVSVACALLVCMACCFVDYGRKARKDMFHPALAYAFGFPMIFFLYNRTCTRWLRERCLRLLELLGLIALEAYVLHHHILLTSSSRKSLVLLSPGWPKLGFLVAAVLLVCLSRLLWIANNTIRAMLFSDPITCMKNATSFSFFLVTCLLFCTLFRWMGLLQGWFIALFAVACGVASYSFIVQITREQSISNSGGAPKAPQLAGTLFVLVLGISLQYMAGWNSHRVSKISCSTALHHGTWFPVNICTESTKSFAYREYGVSSTGTCATSQRGALAWGWQSPASASLGECPSMTRDASTLLWKTLRHRNITFVGDSMVRHLFHATCRQVGDLGAGAYNTSLGKWLDYSRHYEPDTSLEFRWAPYVDQMVFIVQRLQKTPKQQRPDVFVLGGGAWDLLHHTRDDGNKTAFASNVGKLERELVALQKLGQIIVWVVPTEINTWSLLTDDKKKFMREDQMAEVRKQFAEIGVTKAASFVLDGVAFSKDRVNECYDGVHYPFSVYDGGSQILLNAVDWLLPPKEFSHPPLEYGSLAHPAMGMVALALISTSLLSMDLFFGIGYLAILFVPAASPILLYDESITLMSDYSEEIRLSMQMPFLYSYSSYHHTQERDLSELEAFLTQEEEPARKGRNVDAAATITAETEAN